MLGARKAGRPAGGRYKRNPPVSRLPFDIRTGAIPHESLPRLRGRRGGGVATRSPGPHPHPLPHAEEGARPGRGKPRPFYTGNEDSSRGGRPANSCRRPLRLPVREPAGAADNRPPGGRPLLRGRLRGRRGERDAEPNLDRARHLARGALAHPTTPAVMATAEAAAVTATPTSTEAARSTPATTG